MRHTLLPLNERKALRHEYSVRSLIVFSFLLSTVCLLGVAGLFPTFLRVYMKERETNNEAEKVAADLANMNSPKQNIAKYQNLLNILKDNSNEQKISDLIMGLVNMRGTLKFSTISVARAPESTFNMSLSGIAPSRNSLVDFEKRFKAAIPGNKIELPVSQLGKSTNIPFSIQLTEKLP